MRHRALLFDLDGTLVDSLPDLAYALNSQLREEGLPPLMESAVRLMIGDGARKLVERAFAAVGQSPVSGLEAKIDRFLELYEDGPTVKTTIYPGVVETLAELRGQGFKQAVVTNKPQDASLKVLAGLKLDGFFDAVVGGSAALKLKPDPMPLSIALERLGVGVEHAVMVGDNANDVNAAKALGIPVIAVAYGYSKVDPEELGADLLIKDFSDLSAALRWFPKAI